jgi:hypothetical protein
MMKAISPNGILLGTLRFLNNLYFSASTLYSLKRGKIQVFSTKRHKKGQAK